MPQIQMTPAPTVQAQCHQRGRAALVRGDFPSGVHRDGGPDARLRHPQIVPSRLRPEFLALASLQAAAFRDLATFPKRPPSRPAHAFWLKNPTSALAGYAEEPTAAARGETQIREERGGTNTLRLPSK